MVGGADFRFQELVLTLQLPLGVRLLDEIHHLLGFQRFHDVVEGAVPHRLDGGFRGGVPRHEDHLDIGVDLLGARSRSMPLSPGMTRW